MILHNSSFNLPSSIYNHPPQQEILLVDRARLTVNAAYFQCCTWAIEWRSCPEMFNWKNRLCTAVRQPHYLLL